MDRNEAVRVLEDIKVKIPVPKRAILQNARNEAIDMAIEALKQPEIIRCKGCKKYEQRNGNPSGICARFGYAYRPDDFCSRAERKSNDDKD